MEKEIKFWSVGRLAVAGGIGMFFVSKIDPPANLAPLLITLGVLLEAFEMCLNHFGNTNSENSVSCNRKVFGVLAILLGLGLVGSVLTIIYLLVGCGKT